ncbi:hypothetical protein DSO57_1008799 [Entomophthora muscae]|uniref:Uncharacterized protein n=1 Tax=Entomophthora muscae TaxID=34485 RepID=A0ACC2USH3_9FUNG|nr:hypothetical protein DSO57_1008799 [Entomophthora muscae]
METSSSSTTCPIGCQRRLLLQICPAVNITTLFSTTSLENDLLALQSPASYFSKAVDTHHLHIEARELTLKTLWYKQIHISINYTLLKENDPVINVKAPLVANGHAQLLYGANE